jgi:hypothetical protein
MSARKSPRITSTNRIVGIAVGAVAMAAIALPALSDEHRVGGSLFTVEAVIAVPGAAQFFSFDISWTDEVLDKYFLADRNNKAIDVIDPKTFAITQLPNPAYAGFTGNNDTSGPDGVLTVHKPHGVTELWVGDSPGKVWVLDATSGANILGAGNFISVTGTTRADELCYDPDNHVIMIASPGEKPPFVTFIDANSHTVLSKLVFDGTNNIPNATGGLEQCQWSPKTGKLYQNVPVVGAGPGGGVAVINGKTRRVETTLSVPNDACNLPQGMAIGPDHQILLGCNGPSPNGHRNSVVISDSGAVLKVLPDLGGADEVWFDPADGHYFIPSCNTACRTVGAGGPELLGIVDKEALFLDQTVTVATQNEATTPVGTSRRIHSVAALEGRIYLPIPACDPTGAGCGGVPLFTPSLCDSRGDRITVRGSPSTATGCIVVLAARHDDRSDVAEERQGDDRQQ